MAPTLARYRPLVAELVKRIRDHNLTVQAAGIAFYALLAIPAVAVALLSLYGLVADPRDIRNQIESNLSGLSESSRSVIIEQLEGITSSSSGGLATGLVVGVALALWTASGAMVKIFNTLNTVYELSERRKFVALRLRALVLTFGAIAFIATAAFLLAALPAVVADTGLGGPVRWLVNTLRFPALLVAMTYGLAILYRLGPDRRTERHRLRLRGPVAATVLWLVASGLFSVYTANFGSYNETYGTLGGVVLVLLWLWLTALMVLVGAEIDDLVEKR
ncbi:MAG: YihY/virulence factor BrkB family protein [Acidimicrobiales bacterium]